MNELFQSPCHICSLLRCSVTGVYGVEGTREELPDVVDCRTERGELVGKGGGDAMLVQQGGLETGVDARSVGCAVRSRVGGGGYDGRESRGERGGGSEVGDVRDCNGAEFLKGLDDGMRECVDGVVRITGEVDVEWIIILLR